jgi:hypothetical protein
MAPRYTADQYVIGQVYPGPNGEFEYLGGDPYKAGNWRRHRLDQEIKKRSAVSGATGVAKGLVSSG